MISNRTRKIKEPPRKFKEHENITKIEEHGLRLKMYLREINRTTNWTMTRKNLSRKRKIANEDLHILILLLTNSMEEESQKENRALRSISFKPNAKT